METRVFVRVVTKMDAVAVASAAFIALAKLKAILKALRRVTTEMLTHTRALTDRFILR